MPIFTNGPSRANKNKRECKMNKTAFLKEKREREKQSKNPDLTEESLFPEKYGKEDANSKIYAKQRNGSRKRPNKEQNRDPVDFQKWRENFLIETKKAAEERNQRLTEGALMSTLARDGALEKKA